MKCRVIAGIYSKPDLSINEFDIFFEKNVTQINILNRDSYCWDIEYDSENKNNSEITYLYIDQVYHEGYSHYIFESSIHLFLYVYLKTIIPNIKLLSFKRKGFKSIMYKSFNINDEDIHSEISNKNNIIIFPKAVSLADHSNIIDNCKINNNLYNFFKNKIGNINKDIDILYFPRGNKENYVGNERTIYIQPFLEQMIRTIPNSLVYMADVETKDMTDQIRLIHRSKILILDMGSNFLANHFFSGNTKIISIGFLQECIKNNPRSYQLVLESIKRGTQIYYIKENPTPDEMMAFINDIINDNIPPFEHPPYDPSICWKLKCEPCNK